MASAETIHITGPGGLRGMIDTAAWPLDSSREEAVVERVNREGDETNPCT